MSTWTLEAWIEHSREMDKERALALATLSRAGEKALDLAAENQKLRDEAHNEILKKWQEERSVYATKLEMNAMEDKISVQLAPLNDFKSFTGGHRQSSLDSRGVLYGLGLLIIGIGSWISPHIH